MLVYEIYDTIENKYYVGITKRTLKARKVEQLVHKWVEIKW